MTKVLLKDLDSRQNQIFDYEYLKNGATFNEYENGVLLREKISKQEVLENIEIAKNENYKVIIFE